MESIRERSSTRWPDREAGLCQQEGGADQDQRGEEAGPLYA